MGAATGAELARREQVTEKRRADEERNTIYAGQVAATLAAGNQRRQSDLIKAYQDYLAPDNSIRADSDAANLAAVDGINFEDLNEGQKTWRFEW